MVLLFNFLQRLKNGTMDQIESFKNAEKPAYKDEPMGINVWTF